MSYLVDQQQQQHNSYFSEDLTKLTQPLRTSSSSSLSSTQSNNYSKQQPQQQQLPQTTQNQPIDLQLQSTQTAFNKPDLTLNETSNLEEPTNENNNISTSASTAAKPPVLYAWMKKVHLNNSSKFILNFKYCVFCFSFDILNKLINQKKK
jgi:hypothetical protein